MNKRQNSSIFKRIIVNHINNNARNYIIVLLVLLIGIVLGVFFINNSSEAQKSEISSYINNYISSLKQDNIEIDNKKLLFKSMSQNIITALVIWFMGSTVIGVFVVYLTVLYRGFCLSCTIASSIATLGLGKGAIFCFSNLLLQNILIIPAILALSVSGIKLYQSIIKDRRMENIKLEVTRHTLFSLVMLGVLMIASLVEVYVSNQIFLSCLRYF